MAKSVSDVRAIVAKACARPDVLDACRHGELGTVIAVLKTCGITQGDISGLTGIPQGRLSEYKTGKRDPRAATTFQQFADGLAMPRAARQALGLTPDTPMLAVVGRQTPAGAAPEVGLTYPDTPAEAAENVTRLWRSDLSGTATPWGRIDPGAWNNASLRWLVDPGQQLGSDFTGGVRVGMADVERFRVTADMFRRLDDQYGGGHARTALIQYLSTDAERLLRGRYTDSTGRALFSAVAESTLLAAWMSYDSMPGSALAQRYFIQALALAQAGGDRLLGASVLDAMSHQATFMGRFGEAANLARAAKTGTQGVATPTLTGHFHTMEARALARMGDAKGCDRALADAVREFERGRPDNDPEWIRYFDESELSAEFGHCLRDLGRAADAARYASQSVAAVGDTIFLRSDFFATVVLADAHVDSGQVEQACGVALQALTAGEQIRSARCVNYLREFQQRLAVAGNSRAVAEFYEQAADSRLWRIATRREDRAA
jgi:hypothetical protein